LIIPQTRCKTSGDGAFAVVGQQIVNNLPLPYLPVYNARRYIIRTPILDCTKKKWQKQKTEEVVKKNQRKNIMI